MTALENWRSKDGNDASRKQGDCSPCGRGRLVFIEESEPSLLLSPDG